MTTGVLNENLLKATCLIIRYRTTIHPNQHWHESPTSHERIEQAEALTHGKQR